MLDKDIIAKIGVSTGTFYEWLVRFPEIREALKKAKRRSTFKLKTPC